MRTFYLLGTPLIQFRIFGDASLKSGAFAQIYDLIRAGCTTAFDSMAASLESQLNGGPPPDGGAPGQLLALLDSQHSAQSATFSEREEALFRMLRTIASLVDHMQKEVASEPLYATE